MRINDFLSLWIKGYQPMGVTVGSFRVETTCTIDFGFLGFSPSVVLFMACDTEPTFKNWSIGFDNLAGCHVLYNYLAGTKTAWSFVDAIIISRAVGNTLSGHIIELLSNGFRMHFEMVGTAEAEVLFLAFS